jgi:hypothetical protein
MSMKNRLVAAAFAILFVFELPLFARLGSSNTMYVGGTITAIKAGTEGKSSAADEKVFTFEYPGGKLAIPYDRMNSLEYGQKAGRRLGLAIVINPAFILSKKRKHYLTVGYLDDNDKQQAAVFELGKSVVRVTLATLEARSGRKIEYEDAEARNSGKGN